MQKAKCACIYFFSLPPPPYPSSSPFPYPSSSPFPLPLLNPLPPTPPPPSPYPSSSPFPLPLLFPLPLPIPLHPTPPHPPLPLPPSCRRERSVLSTTLSLLRTMSCLSGLVRLSFYWMTGGEGERLGRRGGRVGVVGDTRIAIIQ